MILEGPTLQNNSKVFFFLTGDSLFGIGDYFEIFRSQVAP